MTAQPPLETPSHARQRLGVLAMAFCSGAAVMVIEVLGTRIIGPVFGIGYSELLPYATPGFVAFGAGSLLTGWLGDRWSRRHMMVIFFAGIGASMIAVGLVQTPLQLGAALLAIGVFASIYHPVGIPMIVQGADKPGFVIGVNGLVGNLGIAIGASVSVLLATRYGWQMAYIVPGVVSLIAAILFATVVPKEQEAPARRKSKMLDLPPNVMAKVFFIMTCAAVTGSIVVETVFSRQGLGRLAQESVMAQDIPVVQAIVVLAAAALVIVNLIVDLLYPLLDPRIARTPKVTRA